ncbi:UNVERIFIED_CONTAM: hypothetical protein FKN15_043315 [Acipenser sinensis]
MEERHLLGDSHLDILLDFVQLKPMIHLKGITRGYPELMEALEAMTQIVDWVYQERRRHGHGVGGARESNTQVGGARASSAQKGGAQASSAQKVGARASSAQEGGGE